MRNFRRYVEYNSLNKDAEEEKDAAEREENDEDAVYDEAPQLSESGYYIMMKQYFGM